MAWSVETSDELLVFHHMPTASWLWAFMFFLNGVAGIGLYCDKMRLLDDIIQILS